MCILPPNFAFLSARSSAMHLKKCYIWEQNTSFSASKTKSRQPLRKFQGTKVVRLRLRHKIGDRRLEIINLLSIIYENANFQLLFSLSVSKKEGFHIIAVYFNLTKCCFTYVFFLFFLIKKERKKSRR